MKEQGTAREQDVCQTFCLPCHFTFTDRWGPDREWTGLMQIQFGPQYARRLVPRGWPIKGPRELPWSWRFNFSDFGWRQGVV
jgi:hypothetical protein